MTFPLLTHQMRNSRLASAYQASRTRYLYRCIKVLMKRRLPIEPRLGTYFKNFVVKNGRMSLAYSHLTDPRLIHSTFRASANG